MSEENSVLDNIEIHKDFAIISVNPKLYPLSVIYSAAYWLLDRVHVIVDGDPEAEILIEIRLKDKESNIDLKEIGYEFNDELINYSVYTVQATRNKKLREMIVENALAGNLRNQPQNRQPQGFNPPQSFNPQSQADSQQTRHPVVNGPQENQNWAPEQQPLRDEQINKLRKMSSDMKKDDLFKGVPGIDTEGISNVQDYRHTKDEF